MKISDKSILSGSPKEGFAGLLENWKKDALSGFSVSLIALPLSLGIAGASGFPPIMGVLTAIIGGIIVSFFAGSALTIKGPAAGLIVIIAGSVEALGYETTLLLIIFAGVLQIIFGVLKVSTVVNFFPLSAVHGMLAAIGIIIMSKQLHLAMGIDPSHIKGKDPIELIEMLPDSFVHFNSNIAIVGLTSLVILFGLPLIKNKIIQSIPAPLVVLVVSIGLGQILNLSDPSIQRLNPLINPGNFEISLKANFNETYSLFSNSFFWQYLFLFTVIGSLESLLTAKAIDLLDPWKRKARLNRDLIGVGVGNIISGLLGGLPMISEVARSSANISNGGKTQWANLFHGLSLLVFVVLLAPVIKLVPIAALSAMLIYVGFRLSSPKTFIHAYHTGKEQLLVFTTTIIVILLTDLLIGIFAGIVLEMIINLIYGQKFKTLFTAPVNIISDDCNYTVSINGSCTFSNWISFEKKLNKIPNNAQITIDASQAKFLDHTFMENIIHIKDERSFDGGNIEIKGTEEMFQTTSYTSSACIRKKHNI
jgi:MFS superfamily sulfate permease-like transporter